MSVPIPPIQPGMEGAFRFELSEYDVEYEEEKQRAIERAQQEFLEKQRRQQEELEKAKQALSQDENNNTEPVPLPVVEEMPKECNHVFIFNINPIISRC